MRIAPGSIGNMIRSCRAGWLNSDLIARSSPISATPRAALKLVLRHGDGFTATADAASTSRPRDLRPGAVGTRARFRRSVLFRRSLDTHLLPAGLSGSPRTFGERHLL